MTNSPGFVGLAMFLLVLNSQYIHANENISREISLPENNKEPFYKTFNDLDIVDKLLISILSLITIIFAIFTVWYLCK